MPSIIEGTFKVAQDRALSTRAADLLLALVQREQYVGEVFSLGYETALVEMYLLKTTRQSCGSSRGERHADGRTCRRALANEVGQGRQLVGAREPITQHSAARSLPTSRQCR